MTRNEALCMMNLDDTCYNRYRLFVHKIYDEFESELKFKQDIIDGKDTIIKAISNAAESLLSRTCESCRYGLEFDDESELGRCDSWYWNTHIEISKDFGCNKWEDKQ